MTSTGVAKTIKGRNLVLIGALILLIALVLLLVWLMPWRHTPKPLSDLQVAQAWLECIDCEGPYLERLREGSSGDDTIVRFLRAALLQGPDTARQARHERDLLRAWASDSLYRERLGPAKEPESLPGRRAAVLDRHQLQVQLGPSKTDFLERYRRGFEVKWQGRAAMALGVIRSDTALAALDSALLVQPTDQGDSIVRHWVERARADTGLEALGHWRPTNTEQDSTPGRDSTRGQ